MTDLDLPQEDVLVDETVFWNALFGTPAGCDMVKNLTSIQDVLNMHATSANFRQLALTCVENMRSDDTVQVPLNIFSNYSRLKNAHNIIFTIFTEADAQAISTMPNLVKANFLFKQSQLDLLNLFIQNLTSIATGIDPLTKKPYTDIREITRMHFTMGFVTEDDNLESVVAISNGKALVPVSTRVHSMAYRLVFAIGQLLVQRNEVLEMYFLNERHRVPEYNWDTPPIPGLTIHNNLEFTNNAVYQHFIDNALRYVRLDMINFLQQANMGLIYPNQPPSDENKPLKTYIPLTMGGISSENIIKYLLYIYIYYTERLFNPGNKQIFHFDNLMRQHLGQYVADINVWRTANNIPPILMDITRFLFITWIVSRSFVKHISHMDYKDVSHMNQSLDAISQHTIIPLQESAIVQNTLTIYNQLRRARSPYYLEDGTVVQW